MVLGAVGYVAGKPEFLGEVFCGAASELESCTFEVVETEHLVVRANSKVLEVVIAVYESVHYGVQVAVQRNVLDGINHLVDVAFLFAQGIGAVLRPVVLVIHQRIGRHGDIAHEL